MASDPMLDALRALMQHRDEPHTMGFKTCSACAREADVFLHTHGPALLAKLEAMEKAEGDARDLESFAASVRLVRTCGACPEQYDAYLGEEKVAYLRLRHGCFTVNVADVGDTSEYATVKGPEVYSAYPNGDGCFDDDEREGYLLNARRAIAAAIRARGQS